MALYNKPGTSITIVATAAITANKFVTLGGALPATPADGLGVVLNAAASGDPMTVDLATKEMLVEALHAFEGTMLFVSHDRTFLRGLANRVLEIGGEDGTGKPVTYGGTYEEYVARSGHEAPGVHA